MRSGHSCASPHPKITQNLIPKDDQRSSQFFCYSLIGMFKREDIIWMIRFCLGEIRTLLLNLLSLKNKKWKEKGKLSNHKRLFIYCCRKHWNSSVFSIGWWHWLAQIQVPPIFIDYIEPEKDPFIGQSHQLDKFFMNPMPTTTITTKTKTNDLHY